jgi:hypothetical protein
VTEFTRGQRLALYLYSSRNIVACSLALIGPALLFAGIIHQFWIPITMGLYAAGFLLTPSSRVVDGDLTTELSIEAIRERLDALLVRARPALPAAAIDRLASIRGSVDEVLPRLMQSTSGSDDLFTVRETVLRYLPETLGNYLALPKLFRANYAVRDGKTAQTLLTEQLAVLDEQLRQVVTNVARGDVEALLANGRFLEGKFKQPDFLASTASR